MQVQAISSATADSNFRSNSFDTTSQAQAPDTTQTNPYTVVIGDSMGQIALENGLSVSELMAVNQQLSDSNYIKAGDVINIPVAQSQLDSVLAQPTTNQTPSIHSVERGDTLYGIAAAHDLSVDDLLNANPSIQNSNNIRVGDVVQIPASPSAPYTAPTSSLDPYVAPVAQPTATTVPASSPIQYTVAVGDTMSAIAVRHKVSSNALIAANRHIVDPHAISPGDVLAIPANGSSSPSTPTATGITPPSDSISNNDEPVHGLSEADFKAAADQLGVELATVKAIAEVESTDSAFLTSGDPVILFEAQIFSSQTGGEYDTDHPNISAPVWDRTLYGKSGQHQHTRLDEAIELDETAALKSASWGMFQIMGFNHGKAGYDTVQEFVGAMEESESKQLGAFVNFVESNSNMVKALQEKDWASFAYSYNGAGYKANAYDTKLEDAYNRHSQ